MPLHKTGESEKKAVTITWRGSSLFSIPTSLAPRRRPFATCGPPTSRWGASTRTRISIRVATIVVESGSQLIGEWVAEERDLIADHWRVFGKPLEAVTALAIMVDTDDTGSKATAWFDDISLVLGESASTSPRPASEQGGW